MKELLYKTFELKLVDTVLSSKKYNRLYGVVNSPVSKANSIDMKLCIELYVEYKMPIYKIAMLHGISDATMRTYFIKEKVSLKGHRMGINSFNNYFEAIDSIDKAYFLGLITADGNIGSSQNKKIFQIALAEEDKYIIEKLNEYGNFNAKLYVSHKEDIKPRCLMRINSVKVYDDLLNKGIEERKSKLTTHIPNINSEFIPHFIRGYFDGDGIAKSNGYIGFCGSYDILKEIKEFLIKECGVKDNKITFNKSNGIYYIQWASKKDRKAIFDVLYKNKQDLFLVRKYNKIKNNLPGPTYSDVCLNSEYAGKS